MNSIDIQYIEEINFHTITIDGEMICPKFHKLHPEEETIEGPGHLAAAMGPRFSDDLRPALWEKLLYEGEKKLIVPILVCSDDLDLSCIVIYAEVKKETDKVRWLRIGTKGERDTIKWLSNIPPFEFSKQQYNEVLLQFRDWVEIDTIKKSIYKWIRMVGKIIPSSIIEVTFSLQEIQIDEYQLSIMSYVRNENQKKTEEDSILSKIEPLLIEGLQFKRPSEPIQDIVKVGILHYRQYYGPADFVHLAQNVFLKFNEDSVALLEKPRISFALERFNRRKIRCKLKNWVQEMESSSQNIKFDGESFVIERLKFGVKIFLQQFQSYILLSDKEDLQPMIQYINAQYNTTDSHEIVESIMTGLIPKRRRR